MPPVSVLNLGRLSFQKSLAIQEKIRQKIITQLQEKSLNFANSLILVEHPPVYTCGIRSKEYAEDVVEKLKDTGADFVYTDRGGLITFHGIGQLVAYPILYLGSYSRNSVRCYIRQLEDSVIRMTQNVLKNDSLKVSRIEEHPGVWINDERKVAATGVHVKRHVTTHGIAINCNIDLSWFDHIVPCGIEGKTVTSLSAELKKDFTVEKGISYFIDAFGQTLGCKFKYI